MISLEHLVQHYMTFSDGLPTNLKYPVQPKPKPPLPLFSTIPKNKDRRNKFLNQSMDATSPTDSTHNRKLSMDNNSSGSMPKPLSAQRNLSIPSDILMNQVGISDDSYSSNNKKKSPAKSMDILTLKSPSRRKNLIDGMRSLRLPKSHKDVNKSKSNDKNDNHAVNLPSNNEFSRSLKNLTFSVDFKSSDTLYNVPTNKISINPSENRNEFNKSAINADDSRTDGTDREDSFLVQSDEQCKNENSFGTKDFNETVDHEKDQLVEEIYFIDAPSKMISIPSSSVNYGSLEKNPFFPSTNQSDKQENASTDQTESQPMARAKDSASAMFPDQDQNGNRKNVENDSIYTTNGPNYYIPSSSIQLSEVLGEGEFGSVYKGAMKFEVQNANGKTEDISVAIKTLHDEHCQENRVEFLREASVMIKLSHHCIVKLIGISKVIQNPSIFTKSQFYEKKTISKYHNRDHRL